MITVASLLVAVVYLSQPESLPTAGKAASLGGLQQMTLVKKGEQSYSFHADSAREQYLQFGVITTSLITYYELSQPTFKCDIDALGTARFTSNAGQIDRLFDYISMSGPVTIEFDSGYKAVAQRIEINLNSGQIKPRGLQMSINNLTFNVGSPQWVIQ